MAVIDGDIIKRLEEIEEMLDEASNIPFSRKVAVDKELLLEIVKDIKISLPNQFKQAEWVNKEKEKIIDDAKKQADSKIEEAQKYVDEKIQDSEITKLAQENARAIQEEAIMTSQQIKEGARNYAIEMLTKLNSNIEKINSRIDKNIKELEEYDL
ncbi:hypothetical protein HMPREF9630_01372 [Peptoanaerobacter stomatis]|jgi:possible vacuolar-type H+-ATPase subunit H|uniref:ATPase n=1 Tax=Peptoanaerobacter stomatis TaxID=796937 RepID=J6HB06_9FIRM|nr:hypothetical protein [Peptoanaerobacter stomatis]EHL17847.1 hypothetical protein HMPREF9630_01372 [Peptoanaerobacter stomatis]EJU20028.1 hypothetical protein HMPREF1143_1641 [Peptoanaerobacter stomatis]NWO25005.1 ATPase [Peptostreptococcaceae bacterium oral taxon 081]